MISLQENKSLITIWNTNSNKFSHKCTPIDERITSLDISNNNKLIIFSTENGNIFIYELFSGNLLNQNNTKISNEKIHKIKTCLNNGGLLILTENYFKINLIYDLIAQENDDSFIELQNYNYDNFIFIPELNIICLFNKNKISFVNFPNIKNTLKIINFNNDDINLIKIYCKNIFIITSTKIFLFDITTLLKQDLEKKNLAENYNFDELIPIITVDSQISCIEITNKHLLVGHVDGKITIWSQKQFGQYKQVNIFHQHKGEITNIISINRPISQYGLNFNCNIQETIVKPLKKQSMEYDDMINVKINSNQDDIVDKFLQKYLEADNNIFNLERLGQSFNNQNRDGGPEKNFEDNNFLKKKLKELYTVLNS